MINEIPALAGMQQQHVVFGVLSSNSVRMSEESVGSFDLGLDIRDFSSSGFSALLAASLSLGGSASF